MFVLRHKIYKTYFKRKHRYPTNVEDAKVFKTRKQANKEREKFNYPDNWEVVEKECKNEEKY